MYVIWR